MALQSEAWASTEVHVEGLEAAEGLETGSAGTLLRSASLQTSFLIAALTIWTVLIGVLPGLRFEFSIRGARSSIETTAVIVAGLATLLAYLQYSLSGSRSALLVGLAFASLAVNHLAYGILLSPGPRLNARTIDYVLTAGRLVAGALLAAGIWERTRERPQENDRPSLSAFLWRTTGVLAVLVWLDALVVLLAASLPPLTSGGLAGTDSAPVPGLTPVNLVLLVAGLLLYFGAAAGALRPTRRQDAPSPWLARALILGGFSHVHYMLFPARSVFNVTTGDFLRVGFVVSLLLALTGEVRRMYLAERGRANDIERLGRAKDDFFNILTQELAEPIAAVQSFSSSLASRWPNLTEDERVAMAERIQTESAHLQKLGDQATRLARFEARGFSLQPTEHRVIDLLDEAAQTATGLNGRLRVVAEPDARAVVLELDRAWILEVFRNLLSNAATYSDAGTPILLLASGGSDGITFSVIDEGPGIPPEEVPHLFERFSRAHRSPRDTAGAGLGLYACRLAVEAHGGRIWVESEPGVGSSFRFSLPTNDRHVG